MIQQLAMGMKNGEVYDAGITEIGLSKKSTTSHKTGGNIMVIPTRQIMNNKVTTNQVNLIQLIVTREYNISITTKTGNKCR